jgi:hypothetical protein
MHPSYVTTPNYPYLPIYLYFVQREMPRNIKLQYTFLWPSAGRKENFLWLCAGRKENVSFSFQQFMARQEIYLAVSRNNWGDGMESSKT